MTPLRTPWRQTRMCVVVTLMRLVVWALPRDTLIETDAALVALVRALGEEV